MTAYLIYCLVGRIFLYISQKFPFAKIPFIGKWWNEGKFLRELFDCDLCFGVWVYTALAFLFKMNMVDEYFYYPIICELITGMVTSLLVHLVALGWNAKFQVLWMQE